MRHPIIAEHLLSIRHAGTHALLVEFKTLDEVTSTQQALTAQPLPGQAECVVAAQTILLTFVSTTYCVEAVEVLRHRRMDVVGPMDPAEVDVEVVYDGEDLALTAEALGLSPAALVAWHSGQAWRGSFVGFSPGFTYCVPSEQGLSVPRRDTPRTRVPTGSVAVAGQFSGVYPRTSPGGWQLLGHTQVVMWDIHREHPALILPGDIVRYRAVPESLRLSAPHNDQPAVDTSHEESHQSTLTVIHPGLLLLIEDQGRIGYQHLGVSRAGAADEPAAFQANRLVGNQPNDAVLEILNGGARFRAEQTCVVAVTGAEVPLTVAAPSGRQRNPTIRTPFALLAGEELSLGTPAHGLRAILALRGGIGADPVLGSASADTLSGLGPPPLKVGDSLWRAGAPQQAVGGSEATTLPERGEGGAITLRFTFGPRQDWFSLSERETLQRQRWVVSQDSNRVGLRLIPDPEDPRARPLQRDREGELISEGMVRGALQIPPTGTPVLFLNDHPTTGGYPVIGVVVAQDLSMAAQLRPKDTIRLCAVDALTLHPLKDSDRLENHT